MDNNRLSGTDLDEDMAYTIEHYLGVLPPR